MQGTYYTPVRGRQPSSSSLRSSPTSSRDSSPDMAERHTHHKHPRPRSVNPNSAHTFSPAMPSNVPSYANLAHKSAHHLHSIPPREKSTRTLILDSLLWSSGRSRFKQARASLGMEIYGEDKEDGDDSQGEDVDVLGYNAGGTPRPVVVNTKAVDWKVVKAMRERANGNDNVASAMLEQPPDDLTFNDDGTPREGQHKLPNGVRVRLALTCLIREFFGLEDAAPIKPYNFATGTSINGNNNYSESLNDIASVAAPIPTASKPTLPSLQEALTSERPSIFAAVPRGAGMEAPWAFAGSLHPPPPPPAPMAPIPTAYYYPPTQIEEDVRLNPIINNPPPPPRSDTPGSRRPDNRTQQLYKQGVNEAPLCARHLMNCNCPTSQEDSYPSRHIGAGLRNASLSLTRTSTSSSSASSSTSTTIMPPAARYTDLIPRFLRLSALVAIELGRESDDRRSGFADITGSADSTASSITSPEDSEMDESGGDGAGSPKQVAPAKPSRMWYGLLCALATRACLEGYLARGWTGTEAGEMLLGIGIALGGSAPGSGESTSAGSETPPSPNLESQAEQQEDEDEEKALEPDGYPSLEEAAHILFPPPAMTMPANAMGEGKFVFEETGFQRVPLTPALQAAQQEYEGEMRERYEQFFTIAQTTHDLKSHLTDLAARYPPEPLERAALRFCEAISRWKGLPELEMQTRTRRQRGLSTASTLSQASSLSIDSLIHPPPPPIPPIERYFLMPTKADRRQARANKRPRDAMVDGGRKKKERREEGRARQGYLESDEWIGPYGVPYGS